jgi:hypothetical protein
MVCSYSNGNTLQDMVLACPKTGWSPRTQELRSRTTNKSTRVAKGEETKNLRKAVHTSKVVNPFIRALAPPFCRETKELLHSEITLESNEYS